MSERHEESLHGKKILIGISGGIAAYKIPELVRRTRDLGADVRVVMTKGAQAFITPLTLQAVSGHPVHHDLLDPAAEAAMGHIELAKWADAILIAPASANTLGRLAHGLADDLLSTLCLATTAPVLLAPAMNQQMWAAPAVQANLQRLQQFGYQIIAPAEGEQACGDVGTGRMPEPLQLREALVKVLTTAAQPQILAGKQLVITAGPTQEAIDPVRYLSNHSSGKMGFALAQAATALGAQVTLVSGPTRLTTPVGVKRIDVTSAAEMLEAVQAALPGCDIFVGCAAVADYRPAQAASAKMKKSGATLTLELTPNPDILATVAAQPNAPFCIGFAAETHDVVSYATGKLERKKLNMIAANDVSDPALGFNTDDNAMTLIWRDAQNEIQQTELPRASKLELAFAIFARAAQLLP